MGHYHCDTKSEIKTSKNKNCYEKTINDGKYPTK
jgi:hypothetical protein